MVYVGKSRVSITKCEHSSVFLGRSRGKWDNHGGAATECMDTWDVIIGRGTGCPVGKGNYLKTCKSWRERLRKLRQLAFLHLPYTSIYLHASEREK